VFPLTSDELTDPMIKMQMGVLDAAIKEYIGDVKTNVEVHAKFGEGEPIVDEVLPNLFEEDKPLEPFAPELAVPDAEDITPDGHDQYVSAKVLLEHNGELHHGTVKG
jgi:hypothetical protein